MPHRLTWYGHANFRIDSPEAVLAIDPFFEGNPSAPIGIEDLGDVDLVLVTHDHPDHTGQALDICTRTGAKLVAVFDTVLRFIGEGLPEEQTIGMNVGGDIEHKGLHIQMVQAVHSTQSGCAAGYIITFPDAYCLYHAGDTGLFSSMELFGKLHAIDIALLPIGGRFTMDPLQAAHACNMLKAGRVVPMHWGSFPFLEQNTRAFAEELESIAPHTRLVTMKPGETVDLASNRAITD